LAEQSMHVNLLALHWWQCCAILGCKGAAMHFRGETAIAALKTVNKSLQ
jgi:hypothetical protein